MPCSSRTLLLALCLPLAALFAACDAARPITSEGAGGSACTACHGDANRAERTPLVKAAPPVSVRGTDGGAHLEHLRGGAFRAALDCGDCHAVPTTADHSDGQISVPFSSLARSAGANPVYANGTCSGVYCHGATLSGGPAAAPPWSGGGGLDCSSCHGAPPPNHAPTSTNCSACHPGTVKPDGTIDVANGLHVNGTIDVQNPHAPGWANPDQHGRAAKTDLARCQACHGSDFNGGIIGVSCNACHAAAGFPSWQTTCTFCHGDPQRGANAAAPPVGTQGETETTARAVGAHQAHLSGGPIANPLACTECHVVPTDVSHVDRTARVTFGAKARSRGATPSWDGNSCSGVYCHGATLQRGGTSQTPVWTNGAGEAACGTCHGTPPPPPHTTSTNCGTCHQGYTISSVNLATHLNGQRDVTAQHPAGWADKTQHGYTANRTGIASCKGCHGDDLSGGSVGVSCNACHASAGFPSWATTCTFCHGDRATGRMSPPLDTQGRNLASNVSVGVHDSHVGTTITTPLACGECHPARGSAVTDAAHVDGDAQAEIVFGALARTGGVTPTYARSSPTSATCSSTYCHGGFSGGAQWNPSWTSTAQATCSSCHGTPPSTGRHDRHAGRSCGDCHPGYATSTVNAAIHINGSKQVGNRITSFDTSTKTCTNQCHGSENW